jgi:hypothetical protein
LVLGGLSYVLYFGIFALIIRLFSKNITLILGIPLIMVNIMALNNRSHSSPSLPKNPSHPSHPSHPSQHQIEGFEEFNFGRAIHGVDMNVAYTSKLNDGADEKVKKQLSLLEKVKKSDIIETLVNMSNISPLAM